MVEGAAAPPICAGGNMRAPILTQKRAKVLRRAMTEPERVLWASRDGR